MYNSISYYDWQSVLTLLESVAWVAVVGMALVALAQIKNKLLTPRNRQIALAVFAVWAIASIALSAIATYSYFANDRDTIKQSLEMQKQYR